MGCYLSSRLATPAWVPLRYTLDGVASYREFSAADRDAVLHVNALAVLGR
jgi:hypothetical protein